MSSSLRSVLLLFTVLLLCAAPASPAVERPPGLGDVTEVRHWSYPDYTRVVIEIDRGVEIKTKAKRLRADASAGKPERLYIDLEGIWVGRRFAEGIQVDDGLLSGIRLGQNTKSAMRLVVDLQRYERHRVLVLSHPDRLVLDVYGRRATDRRPCAGRNRAGRVTRGSRLRSGPCRPSCSTRGTADATLAPSAWAACARRT